ncbi:hypothetical protein V8E53_013237 [Lactarius tabidus]
MCVPAPNCLSRLIFPFPSLSCSRLPALEHTSKICGHLLFAAAVIVRRLSMPSPFVQARAPGEQCAPTLCVVQTEAMPTPPCPRAVPLGRGRGHTGHPQYMPFPPPFNPPGRQPTPSPLCFCTDEDKDAGEMCPVPCIQAMLPHPAAANRGRETAPPSCPLLPPPHLPPIRAKATAQPQSLLHGRGTGKATTRSLPPLPHHVPPQSPSLTMHPRPPTFCANRGTGVLLSHVSPTAPSTSFSHARMEDGDSGGGSSKGRACGGDGCAGGSGEGTHEWEGRAAGETAGGVAVRGHAQGEGVQGDEGRRGGGDGAWVAAARARARGGWGDEEWQWRRCTGGGSKGTCKGRAGGRGAAGRGRRCAGGGGEGMHKEEGGKAERRGTAGETAHAWEGVCERGGASLSSSIDRLRQKNV